MDRHLIIVFMIYHYNEEKDLFGLFDPFFFCVSHQSVIQGFVINVYSKKGEGTTFNIYLPASESEVIEERKLKECVLRGSENILLVDDEEMILDVVKEMLNSLGYKVLVATSGKEAIDVFKKDKEKIHIVIMDMIMPDMAGNETYYWLKQINPDLKILLSSGYAINGKAMEMLKRGCNGFIQKPYNMKQLSEKLREILDS